MTLLSWLPTTRLTLTLSISRRLLRLVLSLRFLISKLRFSSLACCGSLAYFDLQRFAGSWGTVIFKSPIQKEVENLKYPPYACEPLYKLRNYVTDLQARDCEMHIGRASVVPH